MGIEACVTNLTTCVVSWPFGVHQMELHTFELSRCVSDRVVHVGCVLDGVVDIWTALSPHDTTVRTVISVIIRSRGAWGTPREKEQKRNQFQAN